MAELRVLLCDDDPDLLGLLSWRLKKMGVGYDVATDGRKALSLVEKNNYNLIVTDFSMPEASGLEVLKFAKQLDPDTQVVIITSSATLENAIEALNHGAFGYLTKPFDHLIVFDNMVSRGLEYQHLLVAYKGKAEAQKRRGDMLEDEVTQRVQQFQKKQKGLLDLLGSLPDGILVVAEGGKIELSSPVGERWLAQDQNTEDQPIHTFINQVHAELPEPSADVTVNGVDLHLMSADFRDDGEVKRKAVIIREVEEDSAGAGSLVTEAVMGIKNGLATLYEQGVGTEVVLNVASHFAALKQLQGWAGETGELAAPKAPPAPVPTQAPTEATQPEPAPAPAQEPSPAPAARSPGAEVGEGATAVPPFAIPRERTPTGELDGPRLNTSELQDALRASAPADAQQVEPETSMEVDTQPAAVAAPDETSAPAREDHEPSNTEGDPIPEPEAFPPAGASTDDARSWIDGFVAEFEFDSQQPEASFPEAQTGELLDDDSMFKPRVIAEQMNAKLKTPVGLPNTNGNQEHAPPQHDVPITIQAPLADTNIFRKVLEGLSGTQVLSGDSPKPAEESPRDNGDTVAEADEGINVLRAEFAEAPASDVPIEAP